MNRLEIKRMQIGGELRNRERLSRQGGLQVAQVMTVAPRRVTADMNVLELVKLFRGHRFRHLLVTDGDERLVGVISDRDVIRCLGPAKNPDQMQLARITAGEIMSTDLLTVSPSTSLDLAVQLIVEHGISCLPVLAGQDVVGILTNTDLHVLLQLLLQSLGKSPDLQSREESGCVPQN